MRAPEPVRLIARFAAFRPRLVVAYLASDVLWGYAMFLVPGLVVRAILDRLTPRATAGLNPWSLIAVLSALQVSDAIIGPLGWYSHQRAHRTFHALAHANLLASVLDRRRGTTHSVSPGEGVARFHSDADVASGQIVVLEQLAQVGVMIAATAVLLRVSGSVAVFVMVPLAALAVGAGCTLSLVERYRQSLQEAAAEISGLVGSVFGALTTIRTLGAEAAVTARFSELSEARRRAAVRDARLSRVVATLSLQSHGLAVGAALLLLAARLRSGAVSVGDLSLFLVYAGSVATMGGWLGGDIAAWAHYRVSVRRLRPLMASPDSTELARTRPVLLERDQPPPPGPRPAPDAFRELRVVGLTTTLAAGGPGIAGVDLVLRAGELVAVTGRIGAGKTTLLRALLGLVPLTAGQIFWNDEPVSDAAEFLAPPRCGYVPQIPVLVTATLRENVTLGLASPEADLLAAVAAAALERDLSALPAGLETAVGRRGVRLSGGQIQRVAIARMLARHPQVAVVDDLSSALDVDTEGEVWTGLLRRSGMACIVVTHRPAVLRRADRILLLRSGHLEDSGTLDELLERSAEMRAIWRRDVPESHPWLEG